MKDLTLWELYDYLILPWKRKWYFLAAMILVLAGASVFAWLSPNMYRSETRILVESATLLDDPLSTAANRDRTEERINAIRQLLESRTILERIVEEFRLRAADSSVLVEDQVKYVRNYLEISRASGSIFTMAYIASDPQVAQAITKRLAEILIQTNQNSQKNKAVDKDQFIEQELRQAEADLDAVDDRLKQFKAGHLGELPEQSAANMNALSGLHSQLVAIDTALDRFRDQQKTLEFRLQEQRRLRELAKSVAPKENPAFPELNGRDTPSPMASLLVTKRAQLAEAAARFTAKHPDVIRLTKEVEDLEQQLRSSTDSADSLTPGGIAPQAASGAQLTGETGRDRESSQVELSAEAEISQAKYELDVLGKTIARKEKEREDLIKSIALYQNRLNLAPALEQELLGLMREHDAKQKQVENLGTRKFNSQMAANAVSDKKNDIYRILDDASLPERPIFPTRLHILLIGIGISLVVAYGAAMGRELFEPSLSSEDEVTALFKIPVLASIPEISQVPKR
jgi:polysaccharide biosynthesis transport protein